MREKGVLLTVTYIFGIIYILEASILPWGESKQPPEQSSFDAGHTTPLLLNLSTFMHFATKFYTFQYSRYAEGASGILPLFYKKVLIMYKAH